jgi:hypothetical protein
MHAPSLLHVFRREREARLTVVRIQDAGAGIFANGRPMLEPVARSATYQPNVFQVRVPVDQEIASECVLVLADAAFG